MGVLRSGSWARERYRIAKGEMVRNQAGHLPSYTSQRTHLSMKELGLYWPKNFGVSGGKLPKITKWGQGYVGDHIIIKLIISCVRVKPRQPSTSKECSHMSCAIATSMSPAATHYRHGRSLPAECTEDGKKSVGDCASARVKPSKSQDPSSLRLASASNSRRFTKRSPTID